MNITITSQNNAADIQLCTPQLQAAIDSCAENGGGRVSLPAGDYLTGTLYLRSHVELYLEKGARLLASPNPADYNAEDAYEQNWAGQNEGWSGKHLILCIEQTDVSICGLGTIDGNGELFFEQPHPSTGWCGHWRFGQAGSRDKQNVRPGQMVCFIESSNIRVSDVTLTDASCWALFFHGCRSVFVHGLTILNKPWNLNTDGIDIDCCYDVSVSNCKIEVGDDPIAIRCAAKHSVCPITKNLTVSYYSKM